MTDWTDFPSRTLPAGTPLHRIHRRGLSPGHFSTTGLYRFDPPADAASDYGVCYLALDPLAAYVEVFGRFRAVPIDEISRRCLSTAQASRDLLVADLTQRSVLGRYGVTAAHSTGSDYHPSQRLGIPLHDAGFDGICYRIRHDPSMALEAVAAFGRLHSHCAPLAWSDPIDIPAPLIESGHEFGITVLPTPQFP